MTDEEKAKEMCKGCIYEDDHINCDCPSEYVYLAGLAEGKKEKQQVVDTQTVEIESRDVYLAEKESIIIRQQIEIQNLEKENEELKKEISVLLSCANCSENKGGYICDKEYNDKCLSQKIEYIKELNEENTELEKQIEKMECCYNCKHSEINFTSDSGIKLTCKKLRRKSDDCILNNYKDWELAE